MRIPLNFNQPNLCQLLAKMLAISLFLGLPVAHAQVRYNKETNECRISDDLSAYGARTLRDSKMREVPQRRWLKLQAGDEIYIGEACAV